MGEPHRFSVCFGCYQVSPAHQTNRSTLHPQRGHLYLSHSRRQLVEHRDRLALAVDWLLWVQA